MLSLNYFHTPKILLERTLHITFDENELALKSIWVTVIYNCRPSCTKTSFAVDLILHMPIQF